MYFDYIKIKQKNPPAHKNNFLIASFCIKKGFFATSSYIKRGF